MSRKPVVDTDCSDRLGKLLTSDIANNIRKNFGDISLVRASERRALKMPRIKTGIFPLDYALGGGFPAGRVNILYGDKSGGKTTTILRAIGNAQNQCSSCWEYLDDCTCGERREVSTAFLDVEGTFDHDWAEVNGVDLNRLALATPEYAEQALDVFEALLRSGKADILVVDSLAFLSPQKEVSGSVSQELMGEQARVIGKSTRKLVMALNSASNEHRGWKPSIFFTNQIRLKIGVMFGNPETQPGGKAPGFAASVECRCKGGKYKMDPSTHKPIYAEMSFKIEKNKTAAANIEGDYRLYISDTELKKKGEVEDEDFIYDMAEKVELIEREGNHWKANGEVFTRKGDLEERLRSDKEFRDAIAIPLMEVLLKI